MYYDRTLSASFSNLLEPGGKLRWLFDFVKNREDLDFLIGKNASKEWISVYRGLSRVVTITKSRKPDKLRIDGADKYKGILPDLYGGDKDVSTEFSKNLISLIDVISKTKELERNYENKKEGYYQNILSRRYGINGFKNDDFVILDKEAVVGYLDIEEKNKKFKPIQDKYRNLLHKLSNKDAKRFGRNIGGKSIGNELDFVALDKDGNLLLIEYKHGTNTSGIYLSPFQIGAYFDVFTQLQRNDFKQVALKMLEQKKKIGLINPEWSTPDIKKVIPVLIISDYNYKSSAKTKYYEVMDFIRFHEGAEFLKNISTFNYTVERGLEPW